MFRLFFFQKNRLQKHAMAAITQKNSKLNLQRTKVENLSPPRVSTLMGFYQKFQKMSSNSAVFHRQKTSFFMTHYSSYMEYFFKICFQKVSNYLGEIQGQKINPSRVRPPLIQAVVPLQGAFVRAGVKYYVNIMYIIIYYVIYIMSSCSKKFLQPEIMITF